MQFVCGGIHFITYYSDLPPWNVHTPFSGNVELQFNTVKGGNLIKVQVFVKIYPLFHTTLKAAHYYVSRNNQTQSTTACVQEGLVYYKYYSAPVECSYPPSCLVCRTIPLVTESDVIAMWAGCLNRESSWTHRK